MNSPPIKIKAETKNTCSQILKLSDGGEVCLDWIDNGHKDGDKEPIVLFLPGLTGDSQSEYIKSFVNVARYQKST